MRCYLKDTPLIGRYAAPKGLIKTVLFWEDFETKISKTGFMKTYLLENFAFRYVLSLDRSESESSEFRSISGHFGLRRREYPGPRA